MNCRDLISSKKPMLTEGAVIERLKRQPNISLDPNVLNAGLLRKPAERSVMASIYREYLGIGREWGLPMVLFTPTWRAGRSAVEAAGLHIGDINAESVSFLATLRHEAGDAADPVFIGGLLGPKGDAYDPDQALSEGDAQRYHEWQAKRLAAAGVDFLMAATLPAVSEALGMARAMAGTGLPYLVSFVVTAEARLLDGTPLDEAICLIDDGITPRPIAYMANCTHPKVLIAALSTMNEKPILHRLIGLQANASALSPDDLDNSPITLADPPELWARNMIELAARFGLHILGGCCGTDQRHIRALAGQWSAVYPASS